MLIPDSGISLKQHQPSKMDTTATGIVDNDLANNKGYFKKVKCLIKV